MVKRLLIMAVIAAALIGMSLWYFSPKQKAIRAARALQTFHTQGEQTFKWGIGINDYPTNDLSPTVPGQVLDRVAELGANWVRFDIPGWQEQQLGYTEVTVNEALKRKIHVALGFNPVAEEKIIEVKNPYEDGYEKGKQLATRFKDRVRYYQISNEIGSNAIKPSWPGDTIESYDPKLYKQVLEWGKGAADGVRAADPAAQRIFTGNWITYGFFDEAVKDGLDFEVLGWDWYGGANGTFDLSKVEANGGVIDLTAKLKSYGKQLWITEAGAEEGSLHGEERQARAVREFATYVARSNDFQGFFPFRLHDESHKFGTNEANLGLVSLRRAENGNFLTGEPKQAFEAYQTIISQYKNLGVAR